MNPDKLFDYLEGRLSGTERAALEQRLISDKQLQRELAVALQIHAGMRGDSREVLLPARIDVTEQGRKTALRVGTAFIILMAVNVGFGLWLIARHETKNPNHALLETQMREQIAKSIERSAATLTPAPNALGVSEINIPAATGKLDAVADEVVTIASRFGGSARLAVARSLFRPSGGGTVVPYHRDSRNASRRPRPVKVVPDNRDLKVVPDDRGSRAGHTRPRYAPIHSSRRARRFRSCLRFTCAQRPLSQPGRVRKGRPAPMCVVAAETRSL